MSTGTGRNPPPYMPDPWRLPRHDSIHTRLPSPKLKIRGAMKAALYAIIYGAEPTETRARLAAIHWHYICHRRSGLRLC